MQLIHAIPIVRRAGAQPLTYFSAAPMKVGSVVSVPLRSKVVRALVTKVEELEEVKLAVKRSGFRLRKLPSQKGASYLLPSFIKAVEELSEHCATNVGSLLYALISQSAVEAPHPKISLEEIPTVATKNPKLIFQAPRDERLGTYRSLIREEFARGKSIFLCVPTIAEGERLGEELSRGIESYTFILHSAQSKKEMQKRFGAALQSEHPILIIATGFFLSLPRQDIGTIILERENSSAYRTLARPYFDIRLFAELLSAKSGARLIFADFPLSIETLWRFRQGELDEFAPVKLRFDFGSLASADMRRLPKVGEGAPREAFEVFGKQAREMLEHSLGRGERIFLFCARKGIAALTVCQDCQTAVTCNTCGAPVVLHKAPAGKSLGENIFLCHRCKATRSAKERCATCRSWKLISLGLGIERVEDELRKLFPKQLILKLDRDSVKNHKQALQIVEKFYAESGALLIGTELALHYLSKPIPSAVVVSLDSLLSIPEWRIAEKVFSLLVALREKSNALLVQTRRLDDYIVKNARAGTIGDFYAEEIALRETFKYPPFVYLIKIVLYAPRARAAIEFERLRPLLLPYPMEFFEVRASLKARGGKRSSPSLGALIRIPRKEWPQPNIVSLLKGLSPEFHLSVNSENIFQ